MISERARYLRSVEIQFTPDKIWPGEYSSGLEKYEKTFSGFGSNPIRSLLEERRAKQLRTVMFDVAASGTLIKELHHLGLVDFGVSFTLVDPRKSLRIKISDLLVNHSVLKIGDIVDPATFSKLLMKPHLITFRPVGGFDDYPEDEFIKALSNVIKRLNPEDGMLFAQFPGAGPDKD